MDDFLYPRVPDVEPLFPAGDIVNTNTGLVQEPVGDVGGVVDTDGGNILVN